MGEKARKESAPVEEAEKRHARAHRPRVKERRAKLKDTRTRHHAFFADTILRKVLRRYVRVQARRPSGGHRQGSAKERETPLRDGVEGARRPAVPRLDPLRHPQAGAPHHALQAPPELPAAAAGRVEKHGGGQVKPQTRENGGRAPARASPLEK